MLSRAKSCLILIDLQEGFRDPKWGARNNPFLEQNVAACLAAFRGARLPVIHVLHDSGEASSPLRRDRAGFASIPEANPLPGEAIVTKSAHGAFVGTGLEGILRRGGLEEPVLAGLTTDHCVSTTARMANDLGFAPIVVSDAVATFPRRAPGGAWLSADDVHTASLASLDGEFARIFATARIIHQLRSSP